MNEFDYIDDKIEQANKIYGRPLTIAEEAGLVNGFYRRFINLAEEIDVRLDDILVNFNLMVELDELIAYDFELAKNRALEVL